MYQEKLPLGFTFSFPLQQLGLTKGVLSRWTKGFNCEGVEGEDVVRLLKEAIARRGVSFHCRPFTCRKIRPNCPWSPLPDDDSDVVMMMIEI